MTNIKFDMGYKVFSSFVLMAEGEALPKSKARTIRSIKKSTKVHSEWEGRKKAT